MDTSTTNQSQPKTDASQPMDYAKMPNLFVLDPIHRFTIERVQSGKPADSALIPVVMAVAGLVVSLLAYLNIINVLWLAVGGFVMLLGIIATIGTLGKQRTKPNGTLVPAKITDVSVREHGKGEKIATEASNLVVGSIVEGITNVLLGIKTRSASYNRITDDFYEVTIEYAGTSSSGTPFTGKAAHNRPDLRNNPLPSVGDPVVLLVFDNGKYQVM